ncbi:hypothetical protein HPY28_08720 [Brevibacillus sp. HB1.2]|uniref:hypothetical protein n=1 Tax=Brevibacillus TaxID=55080 RepID=UPI001575982B|nr:MULTISPECIES: hypothetical protein [unclassified Brevibacillus]NTU20395.1 hypothetical protein [Brevibacillus sp. HB1.2]NTU32220.1 hypothetical protein [Brevibacillus sp. HB1.1]
MHLVKKVALVVEEAHFQSTLRPTPLKGYKCPLRNKWRDRFKLDPPFIPTLGRAPEALGLEMRFFYV